jgi:DNA adenine methylase Dam
MEIYKVMQDEGQEFLPKIEALLKQFDVRQDDDTGFFALRDAYNKTQSSPHMLFALICTAYNSMLRFNSNGEYNVPCGFSVNYLKESKREQTIKFLDAIKNVELRVGDYRDLNPEKGSFVYCDPPYLITRAAYNDGWNRVHEYELLRWLDELNAKGVLFGLSNVMRHRGKFNAILDNWSNKYIVHHLNHKYTTYAACRKTTYSTDEVFICNY